MEQKAQRALLRTMLENELVAFPGKPQSIRILAQTVGMPVTITKYDLDWLRKNRAMEIDHPGNDTVVFRRYREVALVVESKHGRTYPVVGQCDFCVNMIRLDGMTRFCSVECRENYANLTAREREGKVVERLDRTFQRTAVTLDDIELPTAQDVAAARARIAAAMAASSGSEGEVEPIGENDDWSLERAESDKVPR